MSLPKLYIQSGGVDKLVRELSITVNGVNREIKMIEIGGHSSVPPGYVEVEYIQTKWGSSRLTYIDTGTIITGDDKIELCIQFIDNGQAQMNGAYVSSQRSDIAITASNSCVMNIGASNDTGVICDYEKHVYTLDAKNNKWSIDEQEGTFPSATYSMSKTFYIGARNESTWHTYDQAYEKIYWCKIYKNDVLIKHLIPCYREADNEIGLYDIKSEYFYENNGSGTFDKGQDITMPTRLWVRDPLHETTNQINFVECLTNSAVVEDIQKIDMQPIVLPVFNLTNNIIVQNVESVNLQPQTIPLINEIFSTQTEEE